METTIKSLENQKIGPASIVIGIPNNRSMEEKISTTLIPALASRRLILNLLSEMLRKRATDSTKGKKMGSPPTSHTSRNMGLEFLSSSSSNGPSLRLSS